MKLSGLSGRWACALLLVALGGGLAACGGGSANNGTASQRERAAGNSEKQESSLPTLTGGSRVPLPTVAHRGGDDVVVTSTTAAPTTTTTAPPTTTTTAPPPPPPPPPVIPSDVLFDTGKSELKPAASPYLADLAQQIRQRHPGARLHFIGHTDSRGSDEYNQALSLARAEAVRDWFVQYGFDGQLLTAEGRGRSELLVPDTDGSGQFNEEAGFQNRRVAIEIQ